jgi:hypothetical protein
VRMGMGIGRPWYTRRQVALDSDQFSIFRLVLRVRVGLFVF